MCAEYTLSRRERIQEQFELDLSAFDFPDVPDAWPGYKGPILRLGSDATTAVECR